MKRYIYLITMLICFNSCSIKNNISRSKEFNKTYHKLYKSEAFNGNVLIAENGNVIFEKSYGLANELTKEKLNVNTIFELASASKQFTAMGIVLLQKEGKIAYNDDITKYLPELKNYENITIKSLLIHTGGLPDYMELIEEYWDKSKIATNDDVIKLIELYEPKILFKPNEKWNYSNTGYLLLASIIERVSNQSFGNYLRTNIFDPLDMNNTFIYRRRFQPEEIKNYAEGYLYSDSLKRKILPDNTSSYNFVIYMDGIVGDGMVNSNLYDLLKWDRILYSNKMINDEDRKLIFSSYRTDENEETSYGFGWMVDSTDSFGKIVSHSGSWPGYISYIERHVDRDKTIIVLQNNSLLNSEVPIKETRRILYELPKKPIVKINRDTLMLYTGTYLTDKSDEVEIILENNNLYVVIQKKIKLELLPQTSTTFILEKVIPEISLEFIVSGNGNVEKYLIKQGKKGKQEEALKIR